VIGFDAAGALICQTLSIPITVAAAANPTNGLGPLTIDFSCAAFGFVQPIVYEWDFGDSASATLQNPTHTYTQIGDFTAVCTATDQIGNTESDTVAISVQPHPGGLAQIDLPVTFDDPTVDYAVTDFGDPVSVETTLVPDPTNSSNMVASTFKSPGAPTWAGTTISTDSGFASAIPFTASETTMSVRVYSPDAGIPIRLKVEDTFDPTHSVETEAVTTTAGTWETLIFDFSNEAPGTTALNLSYTYGKASIFFNFGTDGDTAGEKTYLWDDVAFGQAP